MGERRFAGADIAFYGNKVIVHWRVLRGRKINEMMVCNRLQGHLVDKSGKLVYGKLILARFEQCRNAFFEHRMNDGWSDFSQWQ